MMNAQPCEPLDSELSLFGQIFAGLHIKEHDRLAVPPTAKDGQKLEWV